MKYAYPIVLYLSCALYPGATSHAQQVTPPPSKPVASTGKLNNVDEMAEAQKIVDRFIDGFKATRDITPLMAELFTSDFKRIIETETSWSGTVGVGRSLPEHLNAADRVRCFVAAFNLRYLFRVTVAGKVSIDSTSEPKVEDFLSPEVADFFKNQAPPEEMVETSEQAQKHLAFVENAVIVMRKEVTKYPPEETTQFKNNLAAYDKHLKQYKEQPAIKVLRDADKYGHPKGTIMAGFKIPFHVLLVLVKENGKYKIWLAMTEIPPD